MNRILFFGDAYTEQSGIVDLVKNKKPDWIVENYAKAKSGQSLISATAYSTYTKLKGTYPDDTYVCVVQETTRNIFTYFDPKLKQYMGMNLDSLDQHHKEFPHTKDLVKFGRKFLNDENLGTQFYASCFGLAEFFSCYDVPTITFTAYDHEEKYRNDNPKLENIAVMKEMYLKNQTIFPNGAVKFGSTADVANELITHIEKKLL
jgi:hypothetical protein